MEVDMVTQTQQTVKEWLENLTITNTSSEYDDKMMQNLTRRCGFPQSVATCGIVYLEGKGDPIDIHTIAREILKRQG